MLIETNQPGQTAFVQDLEPGWTAYVGGLGSGKSWAASRKFALIHLMNQELGFIVAPTWDDITRLIIPQFEEIEEEWGLKVVIDVGSHKRAKSLYIQGSNHPIYLMSGDKAERIQGFNAAHCYIDEGARMPMHLVPKRCVITQARGRLRAMGRIGLFGVVATTPEGASKKCWVYNDFYKNPKPDHRIYFGKTELNKDNHKDYTANLKSQFSTEAARQYLDGAFISIGSHRAHKEFNDALHITKRPIPPGAKMFCGCDFNVDNLSFVLGFEHSNDCIHIMDEYVWDKDARVDKMILALSERGWHQFGPIHFGVDKTSKARSLVGDSPAQVLRKECGRLGWSIAYMDESGSNPAPFDRISRVNRYLQDATGKVRLTIDPRCETLIGYLKDAPLVKGGYDKDNDDPHILDSLGYLLWEHQPGVVVSQMNF